MKASEMEVDGETALKLNSSFSFAAFNNQELRLQMMECENDEMTRETSKTCFDIFAGKRPQRFAQKYARFLVAKQVHCYILSNCHWSLFVLINSDDPEVPSSFLSVDHLQYHNNYPRQ